ncbi:MAG: Fe-S protein assembly co-chaperone HscB [Alphaproteobacteria bacterium]
MSNAFAELGLTPTFELSQAELDARYLTLVMGLHPDRFIGYPPTEQAIAETKTAAINQAYQLLKNPASRARCLLESQGIDLEGTESKEVLFEMMELREQLANLKTPEEVKAFAVELQQLFSDACALFAESLSAPDSLRLTYLDKIANEIKNHAFTIS